jgi:hypothetical protein
MSLIPDRPADTTLEAWEAQLAFLRRMPASRRAAAAFELTRLAREASRAGIRSRHPDYGPGEVRRAFFRMLHGDAVTRSVWPDRELLDP